MFVFEDLSRELLEEKLLVSSTNEIFAHNSKTFNAYKKYMGWSCFQFTNEKVNEMIENLIQAGTLLKKWIFYILLNNNFFKLVF